MIGNQEIVLVCSIQLALIFVVKLDLIFDLLELLPLMVIDLFKHQFL